MGESAYRLIREEQSQLPVSHDDVPREQSDPALEQLPQVHLVRGDELDVQRVLVFQLQETAGP